MATRSSARVRSIGLAVVLTTLLLAALAAPTAASDSRYHVIAGSGTAGPYTVHALGAEHDLSCGTTCGFGVALINDVVVVIRCVTRQLGVSPLVHRVRMSGSGGERSWFITITTTVASASLQISESFGGDECGTGGPGSSGSGTFVIGP